MVEVLLKKGDVLTIVIEGMEGFPCTFPHEDVLQVAANKIAQDISKEKYERNAALHEKTMHDVRSVAESIQGAMANNSFNKLN